MPHPGIRCAIAWFYRHSLFLQQETGIEAAPSGWSQNEAHLPEEHQNSPAANMESDCKINTYSVVIAKMGRGVKEGMGGYIVMEKTQ